MAVREPDAVHRPDRQGTTRSIGDIAFFVGFVIAAVLYAAIHSVERKGEPQEAVLVTPEGAQAAS